MTGPQINFPPGRWYPDPQLLAAVGAMLVGVAGAGLDEAGIGDQYARRVFVHGAEDIPWTMPQNAAQRGQLTCRITRLYLGEAGVQQFQPPRGEFGKWGKRTCEYRLEVVQAWPAVRGGLAGSQAPDQELMDATQKIWRDGYVVWSTLIALGMGGVTTVPEVVPTGQDWLLVNDLQPVGPRANEAGWSVLVSVLLPSVTQL